MAGGGCKYYRDNAKELDGPPSYCLEANIRKAFRDLREDFAKLKDTHPTLDRLLRAITCQPERQMAPAQQTFCVGVLDWMAEIRPDIPTYPSGPELLIQYGPVLSDDMLSAIRIEERDASAANRGGTED